MAVKTTAAAGNWNNTASWSPARIPVSGRVAIVADHVITIPCGTTAKVGTPKLRVNASSRLMSEALARSI